MRQVKEKKGKDKVAIVLMLSFCLIALTSIFTIKASINKISDSAPDVPVTKKTTTDQNAKKDEKAKTDVKEKSTEVTAKVPTVDSQENAPAKEGFVAPVEGGKAKVAKEYSMNMVIYNVSLDQYMTHPGTDIQAAESTNVMAIATGTVTDMYGDDAYGTTIEITHSNGYVSKYSNLSTSRLVEKGDTVKQGQVISSVGKSALYESMESHHLHLEVTKDGELIDPSTIIKF